MEQQNTALKISLTFFDILGFHPLKKIHKVKLFSIIIFLLITFALVFIRFFCEDITFAMISDTFEATFTIVHVLAKLVTLAIHRATIKQLLQITTKFWFLSNESDVDKTLKVLIFLLKLFLFFIALVVVTFALRPIFYDTLAISCYIPPFIPFLIFAAFNSFVFGLSAFAVGSFDMFTCVMVVLIAVQFKVLKQAILRKTAHKACIDYHNFLDGFLHQVHAVVSPCLLVYFTLAPIALCFELYFSSKSSNLAETTKSCVYIAGIVIELFFFFCLPATFLMIESEGLIDAVYQSGWENNYSLSARKNVIIMMQQMQKGAILTAGKMLPINLETCTNAFKMAFSFYTSLQIIDEKSAKMNTIN